jgi:cadmium resistance protein CadD (predicted permease)
MEVLSLVALAAVVFATTNVDDLFVLVGFFAARLRRRQIVSGQLLGIAALVAVSLAAALIAFVIPPAYVGLLGLAPLGIGLKKAWELSSRDGNNNDDARPAGRGYGNVLTVAAVTIANGGDNIGVYTPLFAAQAGWEMLVTVGVFAVMTVAWCGAAEWLVQHPRLGKPIRRYGRLLQPLVLIALGVWILYESGSVDLLRSRQSAN